MNQRRIVEWRPAAACLAGIVFFAAMARGGRDLWAATAIYLAVLAVALSVFAASAWDADSPGYAAGGLLPLAGIVVALTLSCVVAVNSGESFVALLDWLAALAVFLTALNVFETDAAVDFFLACAAPVQWIELLVNLHQRSPFYWLSHQPPASWVNSTLSRWAYMLVFFLIDQPVGTLVNSNVATAFLLPWIPVFAALALRRRGAAGLPRFYWNLTLWAAVADMVMFNSHWGWLCLLFFMPLMVGWDRSAAWCRRHRRSAAAAAAAVLAMAFALVLWKFHHRIDVDGHPIAPGTSMSRLLWWASGIRMFLDHPLLGVGIGNYPSAYLSYKVGTGQNTLSPHSFLVQLLSETGGLGLFAVALFMAWAARRLYRDREAAAGRMPFLLGAALMLTYTLISTGMEYLVNLLLLWLFLGIALAPTQSSRPAWRPRKSIVLAAAALCAAAAAYVVPPFLCSRNCVAGEARLAGGDFEGAERAFASAAGIYSLSFEAEEGWARALYSRFLATGESSALSGCVEHQQRAINLDRRNGFLFWELGNYLLKEGRSEDALNAWERAVILTPSRKMFLENYQSLRRSQSLEDEARRLYRVRRKESPAAPRRKN